MNLDGLSIFIINPDLGSRSRLREILKSCVYKATSSWVQTIREAEERLESLSEVDVVFVSFSINDKDILGLIRKAKELFGIECPTFIITIERQSQDTSAAVTALYLEGASGFIAEPYSTEELTTLLGAVQSHKEKVDSIVKQRKATKFLLHEAMKRVDQLAKVVATGSANGGFALRELKSISESIGVLYSQNPELYAEIAVDVFESVPAPVSDLSAQRKRRQKKKQIQHPGKTVLEIMNERQLTIERLTPSIKVNIAEFEAFIQGARAVDDEFSRELSRLFGKTARDWLKMQKEYDFFIESTSAKEDASASSTD